MVKNLAIRNEVAIIIIVAAFGFMGLGTIITTTFADPTSSGGNAYTIANCNEDAADAAQYERENSGTNPVEGQDTPAQGCYTERFPQIPPGSCVVEPFPGQPGNGNTPGSAHFNCGSPIPQQQ